MKPLVALRAYTSIAKLPKALSPRRARRMRLEAVRAIGLSIAGRLRISPESLHLWYNVSTSQVLRNGGIDLPWKYSGSIPLLTKTLYPDHPWDPSQFLHRPRTEPNIWLDLNNIRSALDCMAERLGIDGSNLENWYKVSARKYREVGTLHQRFGSRLKLLQAAYPDHPWDAQRFERKVQYHWRSLENQRSMIERLGEKLGIARGDFEAWYEVKGLMKLLPGAAAQPIRNRYHFFSSIFPEHKWLRHKFVGTRVDLFTWSMEELVQFAKDLEGLLGISSPEGWYDVTIQDLDRIGHSNSIPMQPYLLYLLQAVYPSIDWDTGRFKFRAQGFGSLFSNVVKLFGREVSRGASEERLRDFDKVLMVSKFKLIFDYQGPTLYAKQLLGKGEIVQREDRPFLTHWCRANGFTLITIPFWYERELKVLLAELWSVRADLFAQTCPLEKYGGLASSTPRSPPGMPLKDISINSTYFERWKKDKPFILDSNEGPIK